MNWHHVACSAGHVPHSGRAVWDVLQLRGNRSDRANGGAGFVGAATRKRGSISAGTAFVRVIDPRDSDRMLAAIAAVFRDVEIGVRADSVPVHLLNEGVDPIVAHRLAQFPPLGIGVGVPLFLFRKVLSQMGEPEAGPQVPDLLPGHLLVVGPGLDVMVVESALVGPSWQSGFEVSWKQVAVCLQHGPVVRRMREEEQFQL